ncbi:MAG: hypothetical protein GXP31_15705 [Kiritimatiellaeota bacterium]|nr:hypothetical protein [Kiritimatiellota bacterium]
MTLNGKIAPAATPVAPERLRQNGPWGDMLRDYAQTWMMHVNEDLLLDGFRNRPGLQAWIGEHIGKFMLGALPAAAMLGFGELRAKVGRLARGLIVSQEPDGYLGTYVGHRFQGPSPDNPRDVWDIWIHKYCILALLAYWAATGEQTALDAAARAGDRLREEFGPGRRDINATDRHCGLASGSVLEPIVGLYRATGEERFLEFADHIVTGWETGDRPGIVGKLRAREDIATIGNGKAYEMMSCFVGLLEYARMTGHREFIDMVLDARNQLADTQRYPTGGMSSGEFFLRPGMLPESADIETCVTFTWMQLNLRLYELCGDERALDLVEEAGWNQLLPAFSPTADTLSYFLSMTGPKRFFRKWIHGTDGSAYETAPITCCHNNGHRGLTLLPQFACARTSDDAVAVNFYSEGRWEIELADGRRVRVEQCTDCPHSGNVRIEATTSDQSACELRLRVPYWVESMTVNGQPVDAGARRVTVPVQGRGLFTLDMPMRPRIVFSGFGARGKASVARGPIIYALDQPPPGLELDQVALDLGCGDITARIREEKQDGWTILRVPVAAIPATSVSAGLPADGGTAALVPIQLAGLKNNPGLEGCVAFTIDKWAHNPRKRETFFPEYRVLLPFFWGRIP